MQKCKYAKDNKNSLEFRFRAFDKLGNSSVYTINNPHIKSEEGARSVAVSKFFEEFDEYPTKIEKL